MGIWGTESLTLGIEKKKDSGSENEKNSWNRNKNSSDEFISCFLFGDRSHIRSLAFVMVYAVQKLPIHTVCHRVCVTFAEVILAPEFCRWNWKNNFALFAGSADFGFLTRRRVGFLLVFLRNANQKNSPPPRNGISKMHGKGFCGGNKKRKLKTKQIFFSSSKFS